MRRFTLTVFSGLLMVAGIGSVLILSGRLLEQGKAELTRRAEAEVQHMAAGVEAAASNALEPLEKLATWWLTQGRPVDEEDWRADGDLFLSRSAGLRTAYWVDVTGRQRWSASPGSRPDLKSRDPDKAVLEAIRQSERDSGAAVSTPVELDRGDPGLYLCVPVRVRSRLIGYVVGLYEGPALLESLASTRVPADYHVQIFVGGRLVYSNLTAENVARDPPAQRESRILGQPWRFVVRGRSEYLGAFKGSILLLATVFSALLYAYGMVIVISQRRSLQLQRMNAALAEESRRRAETEATVRELNRNLALRVADFQTLLNVTPIGIAVAEDRDCSNIWVNPALARMMAVPQTLNISKSAPGSAALPYRLCRNGEDVPPQELPMQRAAETGCEVLGDELEIVRSDGVGIDVLNFAAPLFDEHGRVRGVVNACVDISERKAREQERADLLVREEAARERAEAALAAFQESEARFYRLIQSDVIGMVIGARDGIVEANGFFLDILGYSPDEVKSGTLTWAVISGTSGEPEEIFAELLESGKLSARERQFVHKDSRPVPVLLGGTMLRPPPAWQAIFFVVDLTARRELEARLQRAQKMKSLGVMAGGIAHDFNGLLTSIMGNADLARDQTAAGSNARRYIDYVLEASRRAAEITRQVLAYTGRSFHVLRPIDLGQVVLANREAIVEAAGKNIEVHFQVEPQLWKVRGDEEEIRQVLFHIIRNAVEALGDKPGRIEISAHSRSLTAQEIEQIHHSVELSSGDYTVIELSDTGCGMSEEVLSRAFDPFFSTKFLGRGLGLSAVLGIMTAHRGAVRLKSCPDRGTQVQLVFPAEGGGSGRSRGHA